MNGQGVSERTQIHHGARVLLGNHHLYRLSCPRQAGEEGNTETVELMDYEQAMKEISLKELDKGKISPDQGRLVHVSEGQSNQTEMLDCNDREQCYHQKQL